MKKIVVFTDGSCSGNGKRNAIGGIGIHFPNRELKDVSNIFRDGFCTNQRTELYAILAALRYINKELGLKNYKIKIMTDSEYSINCITKWVYNWIENGWKTKSGMSVSNKELIEKIHNYMNKYKIELQHVNAHTGQDDFNSKGNERADYLATRATERSKGESCEKSKGESFEKNKKSSSKKNISKKPTKNNKLKKSFVKDNIIVELITGD